MGKAAGAIGAAFAVGSGLMGLLSPILGAYSEVISLGLMGLGLIGCSGLMQGKVAAKVGAPSGMAKEA